MFTARGRPKRNAKDEESDSHDESKDTSSATENEESAKNEEVDSKNNDAAAVENNAHEAKDESANNNAEVPKVCSVMFVYVIYYKCCFIGNNRHHRKWCKRG